MLHICLSAIWTLFQFNIVTFASTPVTNLSLWAFFWFLIGLHVATWWSPKDSQWGSMCMFSEVMSAGWLTPDCSHRCQGCGVFRSEQWPSEDVRLSLHRPHTAGSWEMKGCEKRRERENHKHNTTAHNGHKQRGFGSQMRRQGRKVRLSDLNKLK